MQKKGRHFCRPLLTVLVYSTILLIVLPIVAPMAVPVAPITAVPLATVPVPIAAMDALVKEAPNKVDMAVPVPAAPNTPAAPNEAAITGAAITQHVPTITVLLKNFNIVIPFIYEADQNGPPLV